MRNALAEYGRAWLGARSLSTIRYTGTVSARKS